MELLDKSKYLIFGQFSKPSIFLISLLFISKCINLLKSIETTLLTLLLEISNFHKFLKISSSSSFLTKLFKLVNRLLEILRYIKLGIYLRQSTLLRLLNDKSILHKCIKELKQEFSFFNFILVF